MVGLRVNDDMIDRILWGGSRVGFAAEGRPCIFGGEVGSDVGMGMINNFHGSWAAEALHQEAEVFPPQIVGFSRCPGKALGIQSVIAVLLVDTTADFINTAAVMWSKEKAATFLRIGFLRMSIDLCQHMGSKSG
jgi:hypothetical protein